MNEGVAQCEQGCETNNYEDAGVLKVVRSTYGPLHYVFPIKTVY